MPITLLSIVVEEFFAIVEHLIGKVAITDDKIVINSNKFYEFLDKKLYFTRGEKLKIYKQLGLIVCNTNGYTSVTYDKQTKKSCRKIVIDIKTYKLLKVLYETECQT